MKPREKLLQKGAESLSYTELLALLIRTGSVHSDVFEAATQIAERYPLTVLHNCSVNDLKSVPGMDMAKISSIFAALELAKRLSLEETHTELESPEQCLGYLLDIRDRQKEHFVVLYLNSRSQLIHKEVISIGTINSSLVHPREVFEPAVRFYATSLIVAHNHPSGNIEPSDADLAVTKRICKAGDILGIPVMDHIIVSKQKWFSFRTKGLISS